MAYYMFEQYFCGQPLISATLSPSVTLAMVMSEVIHSYSELTIELTALQINQI